MQRKKPMANVNVLVSSVLLASTLLACGDDAPVPQPTTATPLAEGNKPNSDSLLKKMEKKGRVAKVPARRGTLCE